MKKFFLFAAVAMMALVGCEKQTQTSLDFEDVKKTAKISGTLVYMADKAGSATVETPVANQRIYFQVAAGQYATNAAGNQQFEATTKEDGSFEIVVPTGAKAINGNLKTDVIVLGEGANRIFLDETTKALTLNAGDAKVEKRIAPINNVLTACQGTTILKGKVICDAGYVQKGDAVEKGDVAAPAGVKVSVLVKYSALATPADDKLNKTLLVQTDANGEFSLNVPVPAGKSLSCDISIAQFSGKYTDYFNNQLLPVDAIFNAAPQLDVNLKDGETLNKEFKAATTEADKTYPTTKNTKIHVKGELLVEAEVLKYDKNDATGKDDNGNYSRITGVEVGTKKYAPTINGGKFQLEFRHMDGATVLQKVIYDVTTNEKGQYEGDFAVYDSWKMEDIKIYAVVPKFVVKDFKHYYRLLEYQDGDTWKTYTAVWCKWSKSQGVEEDHSQSQNCEGTYELKEAGGAVPDGFFSVKVDGTLKFKMSADSRALLRGALVAAGKEDEINKNGTHTLYTDGLTEADLNTAGVDWIK